MSIGVNIVKAVGFSCIIMGTLIYNKLIFKKYFQDRADQKSLLEQESNVDSILSAENI